VDVRIIAATNRDLDLAVRAGRFREDLFHRLNVIPIILPPLRERIDDIPGLTQYFLRRYAAEAKKHFVEIHEDAVKKLVAYSWPGNVRELANVIERAVVLGSGPSITVTDLPARVITGTEPAPRKQLSYREAMEMMRRDLVLNALTESGGSRSAAAKSLGLHEKYFFRLIKTLGIR
jgi:transcriptional regulator with PAS, ATPase and Fis domain